ncbi:MAG: sulfatase-like hydrolase/transferase [Anaerolineales bacterium]|nr:sulfatase-like hydrolase/transferase [Anaerolineales bacterium]
MIDESIRGDHLSVNGYARATTPVLDELLRHSDSIRNWGLAVAGATCSYPSNALILTGVRPGVDEFGMVETHPTVFQYAKAMGYETVYMDAQTNTFWNGLTPDDLEYIDVWIKAKDLGDDIQSDFRAADWIVERTMNDTGNFIVLNKRGVHFLYENSYPAGFELWGPVPGEYTSQPELVTNPYDNGVMYNVNAFFERLLADPQILTDTTILYTSDHGQTLFENGVSWLHCNDTPMEATIPLLMLGRNLPASSDENFLASHSNIMPTLLDLMDVPDKFRVYPYAPSLFSPAFDAAGGRWFFDGSLRLIEFHSP